jgi:hypothetical protein
MSVVYTNGQTMNEDEVQTLLWLVKKKKCVCDSCIEVAHYQKETMIWYNGYGIENCKGFIESPFA